MSTALASTELQRLLAKRLERGDRRVCKLADDTTGYRLDAVLQDIDEATMSCSFVFTTQAVDRSGDTVHTRGIRLEAYKKNPVVLWDHGKHPQIGKIPIGKCEDAEGNFTVVLAVGEGVGVCRIFFSQKNDWSKLLFDLVGEKILRAVSVGLLPVDAPPKPGAEPDDETPPLDILICELCEISLTGVPDNEDCLRLSLNKSQGATDRRALLEYLERKSSKEKSMSNTAGAKKGKKLIAKNFLRDVFALNEDAFTIFTKALGGITNKRPEVYGALKKKGRKTLISKTLIEDIASFSKSGRGKINKALADIVQKDAGGYGEMNDDGQIVDDEGKALDTTSLTDGGIFENYDDPSSDDTHEVMKDEEPGREEDEPPSDDTKQVTKDVPEWQKPLDGPAGPAATKDLHGRAMDYLDALAGWGSRQENPEIGELISNLTDGTVQSLKDIAGAHAAQYPDEEELPVPDETAKDAADGDGNPPEPDDDEEEDIEDEDGVNKSVHALRLKRWSRLTKAIGKLREKSPILKRAPRLVIKRLSKAACGMIHKAANFLGKSAEHEGEWTEQQQDLARMHEKALRGCIGKSMDDGNNLSEVNGEDMEQTIKSLRDKLKEKSSALEKAEGERDEAMKLAEKTVKQLERLTKAYRRNGINA